MEINKLRQFGLSEKEAKAYVASLELGEANIQSIANKTKIRRTSVYDTIQSLINKGLISTHIKKKRRYYTALDPRDLVQKMEERKQSLSSIIPELLSITNYLQKKPRIRFFEGEEGIRDIYQDTLKYPKSKMYAWVSDQVWKIFDEKFLNEYIENRARKEIFAFVIAPNSPRMVNDYKPKDQKCFRKTITEEDKSFLVDAEIDLYGDRNIGIMIFGENIGIVIESKKLYNTLKSVFVTQWKNLGGGDL